MAFFKRIFFFILVNVGVVATLMAVTTIFGIEPYLSAYGINYISLAIYAAVIGFSGAFISLFLSKWMAKSMMGVKVIKDARNQTETHLIQTIKHMADQARVGLPEVGIYDSPEINAFATGWNRNKALVAVSSGLLEAMNQDELEGVLAHEMAHVKNGDMVTMTLIQGIINTFVIFAARSIAHLVASLYSRGDDGINRAIYFMVSIVLEIIFGILASVIVFSFSRWREFGADYGGAQLSSKKKMIAALIFLQSHHAVDNRQKAFATMKMNGNQSPITRLFSTHPPLEKRIMALQAAPLH